jgi:hypothetical protein
MNKKIPSNLIGISGEYFVAAELSRRGFIASLTIRNTEGFDILVTNKKSSKTITIQVKTNQKYRKYWILNKKSEKLIAKNFFYILVNLNTINNYPEFHIVPSKVIANYIRKQHRIWLNTPGKKGKPHKDSDMRTFSDFKNKYINKWNLL